MASNFARRRSTDIGFAVAMAALVLSGGPMAVLFQSGVQQAAAQVANPTGEWRGGSIRNQEGAFAFCVTENDFDNGQVVGVARNRNGEFGLYLSDDGLDAEAGAQITVRLRIDALVDGSANGIVRSPGQLDVPIGDSQDVYEALRRGNVLSVAYKTHNREFRLRGTSDALNRLRQCAETEGVEGFADQIAPPPQTSGAEGQGGTAEPPALPRLIAELLDASGMRAVVPLGNGRNALWGFGPIQGVVQAITLGDQDSIEDVAEAFAAEIEQRCTGRFDQALNGVENLSGAAQLLTGYTGCTLDNARLHIAALFYTPDGKQLLLFRYEGVEDRRNEADGQRDAMAAVIRERQNDG